MTKAEILATIEEIESMCPGRAWIPGEARLRVAVASLSDRLRDDVNEVEPGPSPDGTLAAEVASLKGMVVNLGSIVSTHERWAEQHLERIAHLTSRLESQERYFAAEIARRTGA